MDFVAEVHMEAWVDEATAVKRAALVAAVAEVAKADARAWVGEMEGLVVRVVAAVRTAAEDASAAVGAVVEAEVWAARAD